MRKFKDGTKPAVVAGDPTKFGQPGAIELLRKLAEEQGWTLGFAVFTAASHFAPRKPGEVMADEIEKSKTEIVARGLAQKGAKATETKKEANGGRERFPFSDEAQENWDLGRWKGLASGVYLTFAGLRGRFKAELAAGQEISTVQVDSYQAELEAERAKVAALVDEKPDPDSVAVACASPVHRGDKREFQPTVAFRLERNANNELVRRKYPQGDEFMVTGNFLVVDDEEGGAKMVPYCAECREAARAYGRETDTKVTFYTAAGAQRKLDAIARTAEGQSALADQLKAASRKPTFGFGSRKAGGFHNWRTGQR